MKRRFVVFLSFILVLLSFSSCGIIKEPFDKNREGIAAEEFFNQCPLYFSPKNIESFSEHRSDNSGRMSGYEGYFFKIGFTESNEYYSFKEKIEHTYKLLYNSKKLNYTFNGLFDEGFFISEKSGRKVMLIDLTETENFDPDFMPVIVLDDKNQKIAFIYFSNHPNSVDAYNILKKYVPYDLF